MKNGMPPTTELKPKRAPRGIQPKTQANKTRAAVEKRRKIIIKELLAGKTSQQAGIMAGFSPKTAGSQVAQTLRNPKVQDSLRDALERQGLSLEFLLEHHRRLIEGTKIIIVPGSGSDLKDAGSKTKDFVEVPDYVAKAKGLEMAYKLTGRFTEKHEVNLKQPVHITIKKFCSRGVNS
jgi:hypothetical protein